MTSTPKAALQTDLSVSAVRTFAVSVDKLDTGLDGA